MRRRRRGYFPDFPPSRPREAQGGIRARSRRGAFGESWWARRWAQVLDSFALGARLARGRRYARAGQVLDVSVEPGVVRARVQGSRPRPYAVTIGLKPLGEKDWDRVTKALAAEARFAAKLLAGEMPPDVEEAFTAAGASLFPARGDDLKTECSCPDWSNPCKHVAAVYCLLGEEFDRDPFLLFALRGRSREEVLARLAAAIPDLRGAVDSPTAPLPADPGAFWAAGEIGDLIGAMGEQGAADGLARRLGPFPFWRGESEPLAALRPVYEEAATRAVDATLGPAPR